MENLRELKQRLPLDSEPCVSLLETHQWGRKIWGSVRSCFTLWLVTAGDSKP